MIFFQAEKVTQPKQWSMSNLHSHAYYELYFLLKGERQFLLSDSFYRLDGATLVVIPPFVMHKTEGTAFERINLYMSPDYLDSYQKQTLDNCAQYVTTRLQEHEGIFKQLLESLVAIDDKDKYCDSKRQALFGYIVLLIDNLTDKNPAPKRKLSNIIVPPIVVDTISFFNKNYIDNIDLELLSKKFFISKTTLCKYFKKYTYCTPIEYLLNVRLNKAKEYLSKTNKSIEEIASLCGFCTQNYFGLIFKRKTGTSPTKYRNHQQGK